MIERGSIREIHGKLVGIVLDKSSRCFGCMNHECKSGGMITAENTLGLLLETGQTVDVQTPAFNVGSLGEVSKALLLPLLGFTSGYACIRLFSPRATAGLATAVGFAFLFICAFIVYKMSKKPADGSGFTVLRVIE